MDIIFEIFNCIYLKENDIVEIKLNIEDKTISFYVNDKSQGIAFKNIEKTYFE